MTLCRRISQALLEFSRNLHQNRSNSFSFQNWFLSITFLYIFYLSFSLPLHNLESLFPAATIATDGCRSARDGEGSPIIARRKEVIQAKSRGAELIEIRILLYWCLHSVMSWNNYKRLTYQSKIHLFANRTEKLYEIFLAWNMKTDREGIHRINGQPLTIFLLFTPLILLLSSGNLSLSANWSPLFQDERQDIKVLW